MKKRRIFVPLGLLIALMLGISSEGIQAYAMTNQSITAESGYRLYADNLTSTSGIIKGDVTELLPDYEISSIVLPDGNTSSAEEVNYSITSSGDYTFEIIYETTPEDKQAKVNLDLPELTTQQSTEKESITTMTEIEENVNAEKTDETQTEVKSIEEVAKEVQEASKSEKLTLTVTLPIADENTEIVSEQQENQGVSNEEVESNEEVKASTRNITPMSVQSNSDVSTRAGGYDYTTTKTWSIADFNTTWSAISNGHMDYGENVSNAELENRLPSEDTSNGAKFRFGRWKYGEWDNAYWLQQGAAFSDITFDFDRDFSIIGAMQIGSQFGAPSASPEATNIKIDGGVTISFIPENQVSYAKSRAEKAYGAGYRLGAYNTLPNSIICEYDLATDTYYKRIDGDKLNFTIFEDEFKAVGDYKYANQGAWPILYGKNIYDAAKNGIVASNSVRSYYENATHIGISTTNQNFATSQAESSDRVAVGSYDTGLIRYQITYNKQNTTLTFMITSSNGVQRLISQNVSAVLDRVSHANSGQKKMKLAFTFGGTYIDIASYTYNPSPYFEEDINKIMGTGQIEIYAKEAMVNPDLNLGNTNVRWLSNPTTVAGASANNNAYYNSGSITYDNRSLWPVEGDRIYVQVGFIPTTSYMPQVGSQNTGTLKVSVGNISVVDGSRTAISGASVTGKSLYLRTGTTGSFSWSSYTANTGVTVNQMNQEYSFRVLLNLPKLSDNSYSEYYVQGYLNAVFTVGNSKITYKIPFICDNDNLMPISRNPRFVKWNNLDYWSEVRVITSGNSLSALTNSNPEGNQTSGGNTSSIHYGAGYRLGSATTPSGIYGDASGVTKFGYEASNMSNLNNQSTVDSVADGKTINLEADTRYILSYQVTDNAYSQKSQSLTSNANRGVSEKKRIIWNSDNVKVGNGYEFYMEPSVTMTEENFAGFAGASDKSSYYRKIADAANAVVFKTSNMDWTNMARNGKDISTKISGNGNEHAKITNLIENPGTSQDITIQFKDDSRTIVSKTVQLTIADSIPKVVSNIDGNSITDERATKIIFDKEDYTVSGTFKLVDSNGKPVDYSQISWDEIKPKINVALYKKNGSGTSDHSDRFYRWANNNTADNEAMVSGGSKNYAKLNLPVTLTDNKDGTFTVTYKLLNSHNSDPNADLIQKQWEHEAQWKILAWTDTNGDNIKYGTLDDLGTETLNTDFTDTNVPSVTTTVELIERESNGDLPETMFTISNVQLNDDGTELSDKRNTTTVSLKSLDGLTDEEFNKAEHDYYYEIRVNESNNDTQNRPYTTLTQSDTQKSFNATYLKYNEKDKSYIDVKTSETLLGKIAYPSNEKSLPQSIRFGMRADKQTGITSNKDFIGQAHFRFVRKTLSSYQGGVNP